LGEEGWVGIVLLMGSPMVSPQMASVELSESSWEPYHWASIDTNNKVKPRLDVELKVRIPQHLEAVRGSTPTASALLRLLAIEPRDKSI